MLNSSLVWKGMIPTLLTFATAVPYAAAATRQTVDSGFARLTIQVEELEALGVSVRSLKNGAAKIMEPRIELLIERGSELDVAFQGAFMEEVSQGLFRADDGLVFETKRGTVTLEQIAIRPYVQGTQARLTISDATQLSETPLLEIQGVKVAYGASDFSLSWESVDLSMAPSLTTALGVPELSGVTIGGSQGRVFLNASLDLPSAGLDDPGHWIGSHAERLDNPELRGGNNGTVCACNPTPPAGQTCGSAEPDVIVGDLIDMSNYAAVDTDGVGGVDTEAYAVGTTSCNIGSANLLWQNNTPNVPVIGQNMFRLKNGRFEQIGQGFLKYAFTALTQNVCGCGCNGQGGSVLGIGCSDPYCCGLNGDQGDLGPKYQVNPWTGGHPGLQATPPIPPGQASIGRRLQVRISDLDPLQSGGGTYFVEGQYVTPDDAAAGNHFNNASYRQVNIAGGTWSASLGGSTQRMQPAIRAWKDQDPLVSEADVLIPGEGLLIISSKVTDAGGGFYHYEYAIQNLNSDRSVGSFSVPVGELTTVQNIGFHDVFYHSGEPFDGTDWPGIVTDGVLTWATTPHSVNANANALRWGTLYNFRFDANVPPTRIKVEMGLFKPGSPSVISTSADGPLAAADCNGDKVADNCNLDCGTPGGPCDVPGCGIAVDCNGNDILDSCDGFDCNDSNPCTDDACPGGSACQFTNNSNACDDTVACTINDVCTQGMCIGTPIVIIPGDISPIGGNAIVDVDDIGCALEGFIAFGSCPQADVFPCAPDQNGIIDVDDLNVVLGAFTADYICPVPCPP